MNTSENSFPPDVTFLIHPGIYEIRDLQNDRSYYGETSNLFERFHLHYLHLKNEVHESRRLLQAFQDQNKSFENFRFLVLDWGPQWSDRDTRKIKGDEYIQANKHRCYNQEPFTHEHGKRYRVPLMARGTRYEDTRAAAKALKMSRATRRRLLANPSNSDYYYLEPETMETPFFGQKDNGPSVFFPTFTACIEASYATNTQNARRKIQRKMPGWRYATLTDEGKPYRGKYSLKEGEISYEDYMQRNLYSS